MSVGTTLSDRYRLEREIGSGGIGIVYQAADLRAGARVAVKVLHADLTREGDFVRRFHRGARIARKLRDPHIVQVLDHGSDGDRHFLVMEFVEGRPLSQLLQEREKLPEKEARSIARQVALALDAAHQQGVVHRDISPGNILVTKDGTVKVSDFDVARAADTTRMTQTGLFVGKVRYGAPEAFVGRSDIRSDIYSLGIVLYEMLSGHVPFDSDTPFAVVEMHRSAEPPGLEQLDKLGEGSLAAVVQRCLEKRSEGRFQDPHGLVLALEGKAGAALIPEHPAAEATGEAAALAKGEALHRREPPARSGKALAKAAPAKAEALHRREPPARTKPPRAAPARPSWPVPGWLRRPGAVYVVLGIGATLAVLLAVVGAAVLPAGGGSSEVTGASNDAAPGQSQTPSPDSEVVVSPEPDGASTPVRALMGTPLAVTGEAAPIVRQVSGLDQDEARQGMDRAFGVIPVPSGTTGPYMYRFHSGLNDPPTEATLDIPECPVGDRLGNVEGPPPMVYDSVEYDSDASSEEILEFFTENVPDGWVLHWVSQWWSGQTGFEIEWRRDNMLVVVEFKSTSDSQRHFTVARCAIDQEVQTEGQQTAPRVSDELDESFGTIPVPADAVKRGYDRPDVMSPGRPCTEGSTNEIALDYTTYETDESPQDILEFYSSKAPGDWARDSADWDYGRLTLTRGNLVVAISTSSFGGSSWLYVKRCIVQ